jgi:hypothetical protein
MIQEMSFACHFLIQVFLELFVLFVDFLRYYSNSFILFFWFYKNEVYFSK